MNTHRPDDDRELRWWEVILVGILYLGFFGFVVGVLFLFSFGNQ